MIVTCCSLLFAHAAAVPWRMRRYSFDMRMRSCDFPVLFFIICVIAYVQLFLCACAWTQLQYLHALQPFSQAVPYYLRMFSCSLAHAQIQPKYAHALQPFLHAFLYYLSMCSCCIEHTQLCFSHVCSCSLFLNSICCYYSVCNNFAELFRVNTYAHT